MTAAADMLPVVKPLPLWAEALAYGVPTFLMYAAVHWGIPATRSYLPEPPITAWYLCGGLLFAVLILGSCAGHWFEQRRVTFAGFGRRMRLRRLSVLDVRWAFRVLLVAGLSSLAIAGLWRWLADASSAIDEPQIVPPELHADPLTSEQYWLIAPWLVVLFLNVTAEELFWRGWLLLRHEARYGRWAWLVQGVGMIVFHLPLGVAFTIYVIPLLFGLSFVVQRRQNLYSAMIVHTITNGGAFLLMAFGDKA